MLPWTDRTGRLSPVKLVVFTACLMPAAWLAGSALAGTLGPRAYVAATHFTGDWAIRFLLLTLLVTPLRHVLGTTKIIPARRLLGVAALGYALLHFGLYVGERSFNLIDVAREIVLRFYLTIGFAALLAMIALGATSFDAMIKRLGAARWRRLHLLVHLVAVLGLLHFFIQTRLDVSEPVLMTGLYLAMVLVRVLVRFRFGTGPVALALMAPVAAAGTAAVEIAWYAIRRGVPADLLLEAQFDFDAGIRPAWFVLGAVLALALAALVVSLRERGRARVRGGVARVPQAARTGIAE